jgi:hypothetical protein
VNGIDPSGKFAIAISLAIGLGVGSHMYYQKSITDISKGYLAYQTVMGAIGGYLIGTLIELLFPWPIFGVTFGKPSYRVTQDDINYALDSPLSSTNMDLFSRNNRKVLDMVEKKENKERLLHVIQIIRNTNIDRIRTDTCNTWVARAATKIGLLGHLYWDNDEYKIEQVWFTPPNPGIVAEHALLRLTNAQGKVIYFDNGAFGDTSADLFWNQRITGGIVFPNDIPQTWTHDSDKDKDLNNILQEPGRLEGLSIFFQ